MRCQLDVVAMRSFSSAYNQACSVCMRTYQPLKIAQRDVADLINPRTIQSAVRCCLYRTLAFNPWVFTDVDFIPAKHFRDSEPIYDVTLSVPLTSIRTDYQIILTHTISSNKLSSDILKTNILKYPKTKHL